MLTGVFKDRSARVATPHAVHQEQALAELLAARELRSFTLTRHCEIGPFLVEYLFSEQSLIVELAPAGSPGTLAEDAPATRRQAARLKFFNDMGYAVLSIDPHELVRQPRCVLARLLAALRS